MFFHGGGFEDYRQKDMGEPLSRELAAQGTLEHFEYASPVDFRVLEGYGHNNYLFPDEKRPEKPFCGSKVIGEFIKQHA